MDDIFDSLIYIIITIVAFVISALGKKKKKQAQVISNNNEYEEENTREDALIPNLEKLLNDDLGLRNRNLYNDYNQFEEQQQAEIETEEKSREEILDSVPPEMLDDKPDIPFSIEYEDNSKTIEGSSIVDSDITKSDSYEESELDDFELQKAIIYSEIINRKEY